MSPEVKKAAKKADRAQRRGNEDPLEHITRGHAHSQKGEFAEAAACFVEACALNPNLPMAHNNLGWVLQCQGDLAGALLSYRKALELNDSLPQAQLNLAALLTEMGRSEEARALWRSLVRTHASDRLLLDETISTHLNAADLPSAADVAEKYAQLCRGSHWYKSKDKHVAIPGIPFPRPLLSTRKLEHDIAQFSYLQSRGVLPPGLADITERYRKVLHRLTNLGNEARVELNSSDKDLIGHVYNRIVYRPAAPRVPGALSPSWRPESAEDEYLRKPLGVVVLDNFLSEQALDSLRCFCLESTIWFANSYGHGRLGAFFRDGFNCPLLIQIAQELRAAFPRVIGDRNPLLQMWGFKYSDQQPVTTPHADFAAVNVNLWLTPDDSNLDARSGGMLLYNVKAPPEWDFDSYNRRGDRISAFLREQRPWWITIPYRANRAVIFNSDFFHATAPLNFRSGYEDRRINITMLYGRRAGIG